MKSAFKKPLGFTFIEILTVLFLAGVVALPFTRMFTFGVRGTHDTLEHMVATNLAREKIEEIKSIAFDAVKSDFDNFREIYRERLEMIGAYESKETFEKTFSDIFTEKGIANEKEKELFKLCQDRYQKAFGRVLELNPQENGLLRRVVDVDESYDRTVPPKLKKVIVRVYDKANHKLAELVTLIGRHR